MLRGRVRSVTYLYQDPDHPERVTSTIESPAFTEEDRALLLALAIYEGRLCGGCHEPIDVAWHSDMDGWYERRSYVCNACTARSGGDEDVAYVVAVDVRGDPGAELRPFQLDETTRSPAAS